MPRIARIYLEEGIFHLLTRGNNRQRVFKDERDFKKYKDILRELKEEQPFKMYHYCLMNNHVHMVVEANKDTELSKLMKRINLLYYNHYKRRYGYSGHFWQDRFKSLLIERGEYLVACGLYTERNPVRAGIVKKPEDYAHSSYRYYVYGVEDGLTDRDIEYEVLGRDDKERRRQYKKLMLEGYGERIKGESFNQLFLGTEGFIKEMEKKFGVRNTRLERGRPKKKK